MPASEAQIRANRENAKRSSGPRTSEGRDRSKLNATTHGLASRSTAGEADRSPEFAERRRLWGAEQGPVGEAGHWAMDRVVAASFRIERCEAALNAIVANSRLRAELAWEQDRAVEAAMIASGLDRNPLVIARKLQTSLAGVLLLMELWTGLLAALRDGEDWSEDQASKALDLLGVAPESRSGLTLIDDPEGLDPLGYHRLLAIEELDRLEALRDQAMVPLDDLDRKLAMAGSSAMLSPPAKLVLRYEREAWRNYRDSIEQVQESAALDPPAEVLAHSEIPTPVEAPTIEPPAVVAESAPARSPEAPPRMVLPVGPETTRDARPNEANPATIAPTREIEERPASIPR
jgi:hypothetical protein